MVVADAMAAGETHPRVSVESALANPTSPNVSKMQTAILEVKPNVIVMLAGPEVVDLVSQRRSKVEILALRSHPATLCRHHPFNSESLR